MLGLGLAYLGSGDFGAVPPNEEVALHWLLKAAAAGSAKAAYYAAIVYERRGEDELAVDWFEHAAEEGHVDAMTQVAGLFTAGVGVADDERGCKEEGVYWYEQAAAGGCPKARRWLADRGRVGYEWEEAAADDEALAICWTDTGADSDSDSVFSPSALPRSSSRLSLAEEVVEARPPPLDAAAELATPSSDPLYPRPDRSGGGGGGGGGEGGAAPTEEQTPPTVASAFPEEGSFDTGAGDNGNGGSGGARGRGRARGGRSETAMAQSVSLRALDEIEAQDRELEEAHAASDAVLARVLADVVAAESPLALTRADEVALRALRAGLTEAALALASLEEEERSGPSAAAAAGEPLLRLEERLARATVRAEACAPLEPRLFDEAKRKLQSLRAAKKALDLECVNDILFSLTVRLSAREPETSRDQATHAARTPRGEGEEDEARTRRKATTEQELRERAKAIVAAVSEGGGAGDTAPGSSHASADGGGGGGGGASNCLCCYAAPKQACLVPCGHLAFCTRCAQLLNEYGQPCPLCRKPIEQVIRAFIV